MNKFILFTQLMCLCLFGGLVNASNDVMVNESVNGEKKAVDARPLLASERKDIENSKALITDIKKQSPFINVEKEKVWHFKDFNEDDFKLNDNPDLRWLSELIGVMSLIIEASLWLVIVVVIFLLYRYRNYWLNLIQGKRIVKKHSNLPSTLFGLDMREENLPDNIEHAAQQFWQSQQYREAVSLLYRGALAHLFKEFKFDLPAGSTEHDCLRYIERCLQHRVKKSLLTDSRLKAFTGLTDVWVEVAYAHVYPQDSDFQQLCDDWRLHFSEKQEAH